MSLGRQSALTDITDIIRTPARLTATTVLIGSLEACLLARARGFMGRAGSGTGAGPTDGADVRGTDIRIGRTAVVGSMDTKDAAMSVADTLGMAMLGADMLHVAVISTGTRSTAEVDSTVVGVSMAVADSTEADAAEDLNLGARGRKPAAASCRLFIFQRPRIPVHSYSLYRKPDFLLELPSLDRRIDRCGSKIKVNL